MSEIAITKPISNYFESVRATTWAYFVTFSSETKIMKIIHSERAATDVENLDKRNYLHVC